ncbi:MAG: hypothetical protein RIS25_1146 [Actinomycetota bacterium]|jgi:hypothetical protein
MSLSDEDRRLLDEMERQLTAGSADVVSTSRASAPNLTMVTSGIVTIVVGAGVLLLGVILAMPLVGVAGFAVMVVGTTMTLKKSDAPVSKSQSTRKQGRSFTSTLEDRWDRRAEGDR